MALALNTSHPLYGNLLALICVDNDNTVKDLKGNQSCTKDALCTIQTGGTYGRAFRTALSSGNARGVSMSPGIVLGSAAKTVFIVTNSINSLDGSRYMALNIMGVTGWSPAVDSSYRPRIFSADNGAALTGTAAINTGGHSWGAAADRPGNLSKVFADGALVATGNANNSGYGSSTAQTYIGGEYTGGYGGVAADYVWVAFFDKYLTDAEISALHASLGADNTFALIASANAAPTFPGPNIGNQTGAVGTALTSNDVSAKFSDTDTLTFSAVGTWPPGVTVSTAGVISGTPTTAGTYSGLAVRATDTAAQTVDSDTFAFTISASSTISATLANVAGSVASGSGSLVTTITATLGNVVGAITSTGSTANGTFTSEVLKDYAGNVLANTALNFVRFYNDTTGALVLNKTGVTTNGSGIVTFSDASLVAGVTYRVDWETAAGSRRMPRKAAA